MKLVKALDLPKQNQQLLSWLTVWVSVREWHRSDEDPESMKTWDEKCLGAKPNLPSMEDDEYESDFATWIVSASMKWLPGWNDDNATFDLKDFACFSYHAAKLDDAGRASLLDVLKSAGEKNDASFVPAWSCPDAIKADPLYKTVSLAAQEQSKSSSVWWWILGGAGLAAIGAVVMAGDKGKPNPSHLVSSQNTQAAKKKVASAAAAQFGRGKMTPFYEHGQWWVENLRTGAQYSVVDTSRGLDFEQVTQGDEEY